MDPLTYWQAVVLGVVEGLTEFLPVSSTGHLTLTSKLLGLRLDDPGVTAYTAVIQVGAIAATFLYFGAKIARLARAWFAGLASSTQRGHDYQLAWAVIVGSLPVGVVGFALRHVISSTLRSLWVVAAALIVWSAVIWWAERRHDDLAAAGEQRAEGDVTLADGLWIGLVQCAALIPGVSRSGATISAGLARGLNRVVATELSFFLAIPALTAAGVFEALDARHDIVKLGIPQMALGVAVSFIVAYASIAWLLKFVSTNSLRSFISYRLLLGAGLLVALSAGWIAAT